MEFEGLRFNDAASLTEVARQRLANGLSRRVRRDDTEPALAFLDRLRWRRSDWHPAISATLAALATSGAAGATAVADFFATARCGPLYADVLAALCDGGWRGHTSDLGWHLAGRGVVDQAALRALDATAPQAVRV